MADAWDFGPGNRDDNSAFNISDYIASFTTGVTAAIGSVNTIKGALNGTGSVTADTRQDAARPKKDNTLMWLVIGVAVIYIAKKG